VGKAPLSVESAASVRDATTAMLCHGVRYLPVVDQGRLVAVVCLHDLRQHLPRPGPTRTSDAAERVAIITGGSGGIGHVLAERLAADGVTDLGGDLPKIAVPEPAMQRDQDRILLLPPEHNAALLDFPK
jgi:CBS-domain-containing membrane protein